VLAASPRGLSGWLMPATYSIRRRPIERKTSTSRRRSQTVSTVKKPQATMVSPCWRRKARQLGWSRWGAGGTPRPEQDVAYECGRDINVEIAQLADDPHVAPAAVLAGDPQDQLADVAVDRWPARAAVRVRPAARKQPPVPPQQRLRLYRERAPGGRGSTRVAALGSAPRLEADRAL
jgi:hypothetical protein